MQYAVVNKKYYCGIDLHSKSSYICILNQKGTILFHREIESDMDALLKILNKYKGKIAVCCESTFNWYWLSDGCRKHGIPFYLGHALYMKFIHGGKEKDDKIDSRKLADMLRVNHFPLAYSYPEEMRTARDLLRRRRKFVQQRAKLYSHIKMYLYQQGVTNFSTFVAHRKRVRRSIIDLVKNQDAKMILASDLNMIEALDKEILDIEKQIKLRGKKHNYKAVKTLMTIDGMGDMLSLTFLYEIHTIHRFKSPQKFSSYSRVVMLERSSGGKNYGSKNSKIGNPHLRWAFGMLATMVLREYEGINNYFHKIKKKYGGRRAMTRLAHKLCVAVYYMLKNNEPFDERKFLAMS